MHRTLNLASFLLTLSVLCLKSQTTIFFEDFEDGTYASTASVPESLVDIAANDYYGRTSLAELESDVVYSNVQGTNFYGAQHTSSALPTGADPVVIDFTGINTAGFTSLEFSMFVAEDTSSNGEEDWDSTSSLIVSVQRDGGGYNPIFAIEADTTSDNFNQQPKIDTDFDEVGDGTIITSAFTEFGGIAILDAISLDLRLTIAGLNAGDEDVAFDSIRIQGTAIPPNVIPEPSTYAMIVGIFALGVVIARRKGLKE